MPIASDALSLRVPKAPDRSSRSEVIAGVIAERIARGELKSGDRLPTEVALAKHFGVSRAAVREAIARLKAEALVETFQGNGSFVKAPEPSGIGLDPLTRTSIKSLLDLIDVRHVIEPEIAAAAAINRTTADVAAIGRALDRLTAAERENRDGVAEDCAFHLAIAAACGNEYWTRITEALSRNMALAIRVTRINEARRRDFAVEVDAEHRALYDAIAAGDADAARIAARRHMERARERTMSADQDFWRNGGAPVRDLQQAAARTPST